MIILPIFPHLTILQSPCLPINREYDATVLMMYGAHVIRAGNGLFMIELMKRGFVTHFATNGAGSILDFEFALKGNTCESVAKYISEGQFGLCTETGIINEHPNADGAATGICSYNDFLIYAKSIQNPEHSVFPDFCSAVAGPEVYLKALAMAQNVAHQHGEKITDFTTAVFDLLAIDSAEGYNVTPPKTDPRYYFRPWKTILARTVADGGQSFYVQGEHHKTVPNLAKKIFKIDK